jgi:hypothetical protein
VYRSTDKKFVDAKRVIGSHISKKNRQCNGQTKKENYTDNIFLLRVVLLTVKDSKTSGLIIAFILERF